MGVSNFPFWMSIKLDGVKKTHLVEKRNDKVDFTNLLYRFLVFLLKGSKL